MFIQYFRVHGNTECFTSYDSETLRLSRLEVVEDGDGARQT